MFEDRIDAGMQLASALTKFEGEDAVVLAVPRGGLPLGSIVAKALQAPMDVVLTKKIGHPYHKEYAIGAVSLEDSILSDAFGVTKSYIRDETIRIRQQLKKRHEAYFKGRAPLELKDKIVVIVDDGIATGNTILVTAQLVKKQQPRQIVVAVPVAPRSAVQKLEAAATIDEVVCLTTPANFHAVGQFYRDFDAVSDQEAIKLLEANYVNG